MGHGTDQAHTLLGGRGRDQRDVRDAVALHLIAQSLGLFWRQVHHDEAIHASYETPA